MGGIESSLYSSRGRDEGRLGLGGNGPLYFFKKINIYIITNFSNFVL